MTLKKVQFESNLEEIDNSNSNKNGVSNNNLITVGVRIRPLNDREKSQGNQNSIKINERNSEIIIHDRQHKVNSFTCDFIITDQTAESYTSLDNNTIADSQQQYVYDCVGRPLLDKAFDGYNVSIFAYGQTGSGKTYSMIGTLGQPGLIPRFFDELFTKKQQRDQVVSSTHIEFSYYEIYNEKIYDLLGSNPSMPPPKINPVGSSPMVVGNASGTSNSRSLQIRENPNTGPYIVGLLTLSASSAADAKLWLDIGNKRRATACTNMNQKSSRSHSVFQISLTQMLEHSNAPPQKKSSRSSTTTTTSTNTNSLLQLVTSKINLVDLAGSERINTAFGGSNSTTTNYSSFNSINSSNQSRFKESTCINKSLLTLGKIICLLSDREISSSTATITNNKYLPYRESVLTWLLKESLGGNAKTAMLATVNSSSFYLDETLCTLRYAAKTACIKNEACLNRNFRQKYIDEFGKEVEMNLIMPPMTTSMTGLPIQSKSTGTSENDNQLELTIKLMEKEWKEKLEEAERLKQKEINDLEKSLIVLYENETRAQNCCLINLNEDPSLSEKLIYLLKSSQFSKENIETLIGSDKNLVNIHLTGPLIAGVHCKIWCALENQVLNYYIEQLDTNYVTYLNGEVIDLKKNNRKLYHGDRIIFGGSHFFRFNNPLSNNSSKQSASSNLNDNFKDYQFAKNEIERKQNEIIESKLSEALKKCKQDGDLKIKELEKKYEMNIENIKNELEKEKISKKLELEQIKTESHQKIKQIVQKKILIETKLNAIESDVLNTNQELDKHEKNLIEDNLDVSNAVMRTPLSNNLANRRFINKLNEFSSAKKLPAFDKFDLIQSHTNASSLFAITLSVTEANKICGLIGLDYEFKRHEILESTLNNDKELDFTNRSSENSIILSNKRHDYIQSISVTDKSSNMITLWGLDKFDHKLNILRDIYSRIMDEEESTSSTEFQGLIFDSNEEWQTIDKFQQNDEKFLPQIIKNALDKNERNQNCKRQLSMLSNESIISAKTDSLNPDENHLDTTDTNQYSIKRKCLNNNLKNQSAVKLMPPPTPLSVLKYNKTLDFNSFEPLDSENIDITKQCNLFVYSKCRDLLLDDFIQSDEEESDENLDYTHETNSKKSKKFPEFDDVYLKYYSNIVLNLKGLYSAIFSEASSKKINIKKSLDYEESAETDLLERETNNHNNSDQSLYSIKIVTLFSHLNQFKPDFSNNLHIKNERVNQIKEIHFEIRTNIRILRELISSFYQSIENNLSSKIKSNYESLLNQLENLFRLHGECMFLACSNTVLTSRNLLNMIESNFMSSYLQGVDKQYEIFLLETILALKSLKVPIVAFVESMENFRDGCKVFKYSTSDLMIDYTNYVYQSNFRLTNAIRFIDKEKDTSQNFCEQILMFLYNILTDSLALTTTANTNNTNESPLNKQKENLILSFKQLKTYYQKNANQI